MIKPVTEVPLAPAPTKPTPAWVSNRTLAKTLYAVASGDPAVVVSSPPGAGKTYLISHLAQALVHELGLTVVVAAQTTAQGMDVAGRIAALDTPTRYLHPKPKRRDDPPPPMPLGVQPTTTGAIKVPAVTVATTAKWIFEDAVGADVLLVDEAYQATMTDMAVIAKHAPQVVLVGDPGQISPVVTGTTSRWESAITGPHTPAPTALLARHPRHVAHLSLTCTYRLGPKTTSLIAPLYPTLSFTSARPQTSLITPDGTLLPEYTSHADHYPAGRADTTLARNSLNYTRHLLTCHIVTPDGTRPLTAKDVAIIAPHTDQVALLQAAHINTPGILICTINQAQGLEREAVIAVHPMLGQHEASDFATDPGRLCVALSRHRSHLHVLTDRTTPALLKSAKTQNAATTLEVHKTLTRQL